MPYGQKERGTAAHNTLEINGENSSEVWSSFRVAKRANPIGLNITKSSEFVSITCGHDGYMKFAGKAKQRSWRLSPSELLVEDTRYRAIQIRNCAYPSGFRNIICEQKQVDTEYFRN